MNILLTSVGRRGYLVRYFKDALENNGKIHASNSHYTLAMKSANSYFITPLIYSPGYIPKLLSYCIENQIKAILSLFDIDLLILAKNREQFIGRGIRLILAPEDSVRICNDKWKTFVFLSKNSIRTPKTFLSIEKTLAALKKNEIDFPLLIKPRWGMASIAMYEACNQQELNVLFKKSKREVFETVLKYESAQTPNQCILIQEKLLGKEYGIEVLNDLKGNYVNTFAKTKDAMRAGETDIGTTVSSRCFTNIAKVLSKKINHEGVLSVDCIMTGSGLFVTEMNCRFSGHYPPTHLAGVNIPKQIIKWLRNEPTDDKLLSLREGVVVAKDLVPQVLDGS